jgi:ATP-binding cassette, subfamily B, bacterial
MKYVPRILPYLRPYWPLGAVSIAVLVLSSFFSVLSPWPLTILVDNVLGNQPLIPILSVTIGALATDKTSLLILAVLAGLLVTFMNGGLSIISNYVNTKLEQRIVLDFRSDLFRHAEALSVAYADQVSTGRLMYGINFEAAAAGAVIMAIEPLAQGALTIIGMVWISFQIDHTLALLSMTVVPFLYYSVGYYARRIQPRLLEVKGMEADSLSIVHDAMSMLRVIVAFGRENHEVRRFRRQGERAVEARIRLTVRQTMFSLAVSMITATGTALVLGFGAYHALQGQLTAGQLLVVLSYVAAVYKPLEAISHTVGSLQDRFVGLQMAFHVLDTQPVVKNVPHARKLEKAGGHVTFEHVSFSYPGRVDTLKDISFEAPAGQVVALVGPTGAGKTTLINLLPRFYDPSAGRVLLDGIDIREVTLESLRSQISLVPQEPILFTGTILDNIHYGRLDATTDEVIEAAKSANAHDFIMRLPNQYETQVGERGVLILDEPTSSIDSRTEAVILDALDRLMVGRTTFVIAHRLSTVRYADLILVLDRGELVEQGTADELLQQNGLYRQLHDVQTSQRARKILPEEVQEEPPDDSTKPLIGEPAPPASLPFARPSPTPYAVEWTAHDIPPIATPGQVLGVRLGLRNTGDFSWPSSNAPRWADMGTTAPYHWLLRYAWTMHPVSISYHWLHESGKYVEWDGRRTPLPWDVVPGEEVCVDEVVVVVPEEPGRYQLQITLVHEFVAWFDSQGASMLTVPITVTADGLHDSLEPATQELELMLAGASNGTHP